MAGCAATKDYQPELLMSASFQSSTYERLVIVVVDDSRTFRDKGVLRQIEDEFMKAAIAKGYDVVTRSDKDQLVDELMFQGSKYASNVNASEIGEMFNVPAVLIVRVNAISTREYSPILRMDGQRYYATTASLSARFVTTEHAQVLFVLNHTNEVKGNNRYQGEDAAISCARVMSRSLPGRNGSAGMH